MATGETAQTGGMDINDVTLTVAAIEGINARLSDLTTQLLGANATILSLSQNTYRTAIQEGRQMALQQPTKRKQ